MIKKVKMFFVFVLFAMFYPLGTRQVSEQRGAQPAGIKGFFSRFGIPSAMAGGCCPPGTAWNGEKCY